VYSNKKKLGGIMNLKNFSIITLIFVIPIVAYMILSHSGASQAIKSDAANKPQIIKFTSVMCLDCKKLGGVIKEVYPSYSDKIVLTEVQVQNNDEYTKKQISKYNITLVPTMVLLDSKGKKVNKIEGFVEKSKLEKLMKDLAND
jgi:thioredoxin-like negative regulator of GroEL